MSPSNHRHLRGLALLSAAGVTDPPPGFNGAALLDDIEDAGRVHWLATRAVGSQKVTRTDLKDFETHANAIRSAADALRAIARQPIFNAALHRGFEIISDDEAEAEAGMAACLLPSTDRRDQLELLAPGLLAMLKLATKRAREILRHEVVAGPQRVEELAIGPGKPYDHLLANILPAIFKRHLGRPHGVWPGSTGARLTRAALAHLGIEAPPEDGSLGKTIQRQRRRQRNAEREGSGDIPADGGHTP